MYTGRAFERVIKNAYDKKKTKKKHFNIGGSRYVRCGKYLSGRDTGIMRKVGEPFRLHPIERRTFLLALLTRGTIIIISAGNVFCEKKKTI